MSYLWQPTCSPEQLSGRAALLLQLRQFFAARDILEVDTPLLSQHTVTDVHIDSCPVQCVVAGLEQTYYLQTSPEYAMKRLLAAGAGAIYQICKAFRNDELGQFHNPEFTLLEWYRPGFTHHQLMDEVQALFVSLFSLTQFERWTYTDLFIKVLSINPLTASVEALAACAQQAGIDIQTSESEVSAEQQRDFWLALLLTHCVEPALAEMPGVVFLYDFPASQAALAKIDSSQTPAVAERFEVYYQGVELANGFCELTDAAEQAARFESEREVRAQQGRVQPEIDQRFIAALQAGMPECAGVALGIERLQMCMTGASAISEVITFPVDRA